MTSLPDVVTSELPDVNTSVSFNATMAAINTKSFAGRMSPTPVPLVAILLILSVLGMCGNGFTLITVQMTARLWTKTNVIMASMLMSYFFASLSLICINFYLLYNITCRFHAVVNTVTYFWIKTAVYVSSLHTIMVSVERYIAIVHPLQYETTFTDRTLKRAISAVWMIGIFIGLTFMLWLIDAHLRKCPIIPVHYELLDVVIFTLICICLLACYGKILVISWHHHQHIEPQLAIATPATGSSLQTTASPNVTQSNRATTSDKTMDPNDKPMTGTESLSQTAGGASSDLTREQQRQQIKSRRREFKAAYVVTAIVGAWAILTLPRMIGVVLLSLGYNPAVTRNIITVGQAMGTLKFAYTWAVYAVMSKSYRRTYRQMLIHIGCCCCKKITPPTDNSLVA